MYSSIKCGKIIHLLVTILVGKKEYVVKISSGTSTIFPQEVASESVGGFFSEYCSNLFHRPTFGFGDSVVSKQPKRRQ